MNLNAALARLKHASDNLEHRGLAGTISTDQAHDLTAVNIKRDVLKRPKLLKEQLMLSELNKTFFEAVSESDAMLKIMVVASTSTARGCSL